MRLFGTLRGPDGRAAGGSVDWPESTYAIEASAADTPVAAVESSLMGDLDDSVADQDKRVLLYMSEDIVGAERKKKIN